MQNENEEREPAPIFNAKLILPDGHEIPLVPILVGFLSDCQDEPHLIATTPEEADELLELWEQGVILDRQKNE